MPFDNPYQTPFGDLELLMGARSRISDPDNWTKGSFSDGKRHCLVAALSLVAGSRSYNFPNRTERRLVGLLANQLPPGRSFFTRITFISARQRLMWFNDGYRTKHDDVMALFDRTVDNLTSKAPQYVTA